MTNIIHSRIKKIASGFIALISISFLLTATAADSSQGSLSSLLDNNDSENFLPPDVAFKLNLNAVDANTIRAAFTIVPGHYLYRQRIKFEIPAKNSAAQIDSVSLPNGDIKDDPNFGKQEVYHHDFNADIKLSHVQNSQITINATYQGCSEKGLCYAPIKKKISVTLPAAGELSNATGNVEIANEADKTTEVLRSGNLWLVITAFFAAGLLLSFTPCVLPMIPILSSIIVGSQSRQNNAVKPSKLHAFGLSVAYVLGMALAYTLAGIAAGLSGSLLSQSLQSPWALGATAVIFVILALSMFGVYELKLPASFESKMLNVSNKLKGGEFLGVFIMGVLSALIVSPCVAAPLAGALIYIGQTHNVLLGGLGLFALAIGMGVPLLLIGASAGSLLPKAGRWMTTVRNLFGVLMLVMAAYIVWPVLPAAVTAPVEKLLGSNSKHTLPFKPVKSVAELEAAIKAANGKSVMLDFYADWCTSCKEMEKLTFTDGKVKAALQNTVLLQADVTENNDNDQALLKRFELFGPPGIIFFDKDGEEIRSIRTIGFQNAERFNTTLSKR
ncbi:MAG TPA: protein-disulfide reductase DsbD [Methylotenera sp.]|nr:protein-disulfide reductase DsbD [Methylotenera sp.]